MKKRIVSIGVAAFVTVAALAGTATAAPLFTHGVGTYQVTGVVVHSSRQIDTTTVVTQTFSVENAGVLDGPSTADVVCLIQVTGSGACAGIENFTGTIGGRTGTARFAVALTIDASGFHGRLVALRGSGGLAGLRATGTFEGGSTGNNTLDYRFG